jgi:hypothetical protein
LEAELTSERARAVDAEAGLRAELVALYTARDRAVAADEEVRAARAAELEALRAAGERLRATAPADPPPDLVAGLAAAAQRLRERVPEEEPRPPEPTPPPEPAEPAAEAPVAPPSRGPLRRALRRLRGRHD